MRSVILNWRQRPTGHSSERERPAGHSSEGEGSPVAQVNLSDSLWVFSGRCTTSQKRPTPQKNDMCELALTIFLLHTIVPVEEWKYELYFYISTSCSLFVLRCDMRHNHPPKKISGIAIENINFYSTLFICLRTVKWFQVLLRKKYSMEH